MKKCTHCGAMIADDNARFCLNCGKECEAVQPAQTTINKKQDEAGDAASLVGDKNVISESTIIGRQDKYEASNITIHNNITEDHSHTTVVCAVSGKRIYMDQSIVCPKCGKPVASEYYVETSKRCENCENDAIEEYRRFAVQTLAGKTLDNRLKAVLDDEARKLHIAVGKQTEVLRSLQNEAKGKDVVLSAVQQAELDAAIKRFMVVNNSVAAQKEYRVFKALHEASQNYVVDFWYYLSSAAIDPEEYIKTCEEELTENYWQRYWAYLAYCALGSAKGGAAIDHLRKVYGEREDDIRLAEAAYLLARGFSSFDSSMTSRAGEMVGNINPDYLSKPLLMVFNTLKRLSEEGLHIEPDYYNEEEYFVVVIIFCGGQLIEKLLEEKAAHEEQMRREAAAKAEAEAREREAEARREAAEREAKAKREREEREAAERARQAKQRAMTEDREKRMAEEMARLGGDKQPKGAKQEKIEDKAFVGYQTSVPEKKKSKVGKILLYVVLALVVLLALLFIIPAPESMQ